ncbi:hypothetical protein J1605_013015 [Eschrichtius robustus]|uniref:Uncharacterized protein n=1 Tax=Eschrichtius robustus TaxID=9764 RepID=A0AB34GL86_ESCRO|nr:hypothetical protein J1605_013015 [Eschrichtius robustus]
MERKRFGLGAASAWVACQPGQVEDKHGVSRGVCQACPQRACGCVLGPPTERSAPEVEETLVATRVPLGPGSVGGPGTRWTARSSAHPQPDGHAAPKPGFTLSFLLWASLLPPQGLLGARGQGLAHRGCDSGTRGTPQGGGSALAAGGPVAVAPQGFALLGSRLTLGAFLDRVSRDAAWDAYCGHLSQADDTPLAARPHSQGPSQSEGSVCSGLCFPAEAGLMTGHLKQVTEVYFVLFWEHSLFGVTRSRSVFSLTFERVRSTLGGKQARGQSPGRGWKRLRASRLGSSSRERLRSGGAVTRPMLRLPPLSAQNPEWPCRCRSRARRANSATFKSFEDRVGTIKTKVVSGRENGSDNLPSPTGSGDRPLPDHTPF